MDIFEDNKNAAMDAARRQKLEDLAAVARTLEGERFLAGLLADCGVGHQASQSDLPTHNLGIVLMRDIARATPNTALNILAVLYGILQP